MIKKLLIATLVIFTFYSCDVGDDNNNFEIKTLVIKEAVVPTEFEFGNSYTLKVVYDLPNGCHSFYDLFYQYDGPSRIVAVNSLVNLNLECTEALIEEEHNFIVNVTQEEDYTFRFWKGKDNNGNDIFEDIIVPVI